VLLKISSRRSVRAPAWSADDALAAIAKLKLHELADVYR